MNIILIGYMASGKSLIGENLSHMLNMQFIDFDNYIEKKEDASIHDIFERKGELYFRKIENAYLKELLNETKNTVLSLGGGTPCYGNNMQLIQSFKNNKTVYLNVSVSELSGRLMNDKSKRPLLKYVHSKQDMDEFVGKHLFERLNYYNQADIIVNANKNPDEVVENIVLQLF